LYQIFIYSYLWFRCLINHPTHRLRIPSQPLVNRPHNFPNFRIGDVAVPRCPESAQSIPKLSLWTPYKRYLIYLYYICRLFLTFILSFYQFFFIHPAFFFYNTKKLYIFFLYSGVVIKSWSLRIQPSPAIRLLFPALTCHIMPFPLRPKLIKHNAYYITAPECADSCPIISIILNSPTPP